LNNKAWYIIRHGQTLENSLHIQQGSTASLLTLQGIDQAKSIGLRLKEREEDFSQFKFLCSPLIRTRHTMQIIIEVLGLGGKIKPIVEPLIVNTCKGILENVKKDEIKNLFPEEYKKKQDDPWNYVPPGGESKASCFERLKEFTEKYKDEKHLVIVGHRGVNRRLLGILLNHSAEDVKNSFGDEFKSQNYFYLFTGKDLVKI